MTKVLEFLVRTLILPILYKWIDSIGRKVRDKGEDKKRDDKLSEAIEKMKGAKSEQEKKYALKELISGIGDLNS